MINLLSMNILKKCFWGAILVVCICFVSGCDGNDHSSENTHHVTNTHNQGMSAEQVIKAYLDLFLIKREIASAYDYLSVADRKIKSKEAFVKEKNSVDWEKVYKQVNTYTIKQSHIQSDQASFSVAIQTADLRTIFQEILRNPEVQTISSQEKGRRDTLIQRKIKAYQADLKKLPMTTLNHEFKLIKEQGVWGVHFDWQAEPSADKKMPEHVD